ncbi:hypothetical protein AAFF_G00067030 [Aldrovandia affinis]|uniref:Uncharacterized protein n=1 Tax=Aldrovandia affinis TaxID=143900 RepID=A0AAD7WYX1_9TELE|nr:hypothetical protein AAFF_G00067030 [Aldrovandia affinis]
MQNLLSSHPMQDVTRGLFLCFHLLNGGETGVEVRGGGMKLLPEYCRGNTARCRSQSRQGDPGGFRFTLALRDRKSRVFPGQVQPKRSLASDGGARGAWHINRSRHNV